MVIFLNIVTISFGQLNPSYFGLELQAHIPMTILTPSAPETTTLFHSFSIKKEYNSTHTLVKMFSDRKILDSAISEMYIGKPRVWHHSWDNPGSYTQLPPRKKSWDAPFELHKGLWHTSSMEGWISCMETQTIAGRNVANLIKRDLFKEGNEEL